MKILYDPTVDALYLKLRELEPGTAETRKLTDDILADYGPDGKLAGLEILDASQVLSEGELHSMVHEVYPAKAA